MKTDTDKTKAKLRPKPSKPKSFLKLSTGATLGNLALSGHASWGMASGCFYNLIGQSRAGKTWLALQCLAEAAINPAFKDYRLIVHKPEHGARMNITKFFGKALADRIEWRKPRMVEECYYMLWDDMKQGPCISVIDSWDALTASVDRDKFLEKKAAFEKGKDTTGSYGMAPPKLHSANLREVVNNCEVSGSIVIGISQSRTNIGFGSQYKPETRSGGVALTFFATGELWFKIRGEHRRRVKGKDETIGHRLLVKVEKNRESGWEPDVELHHYVSYGLDDVGSCVAFLIERGLLKEIGDKKKIEAKQFGLKLDVTREELIRSIDNPEGRRTLRLLTAELWKEIEAACAIDRQPKYI